MNNDGENEFENLKGQNEELRKKGGKREIKDQVKDIANQEVKSWRGKGSSKGHLGTDDIVTTESTKKIWKKYDKSYPK